MDNRNPITSLAAVAIFCFMACGAIAQSSRKDIKFGSVSAQDFNITSSDTGYGAVVIADIGSTKFVGNRNGWFNHVFKRLTRIKILSSSAFSLATQRLFLYKKGDSREELTDIDAATYSLENGKIITTALDKKDVFESRYNKNFLEKTFTLPGVKIGSVIEISYTITSDFDFRLHNWEFQSTQYPCLYSEYQVGIPNLLIYAAARQGQDSFYATKAWETRENFLITQRGLYNPAYGEEDQDVNVSAIINNRFWAMKDIKPLKSEPYTSSLSNYVDKIVFQLNQVSNGKTTKPVMNDWHKASEELMNDKEFGAVLSEQPSWLADEMQKIPVADGGLQFAQNAYGYIRDNFNCTGYTGFYIQSSLRDVLKSHSGNVGELNLLYILMLKQKGIAASPVLLSTRENGYTIPGYPLMEKFNYLICRAVIDGQPYMIDCSHRMLSFGMLPDNCYNGEARIIDTNRPDSVYLSADSITEQKVSLVTISAANGQFVGSAKITPGQFEAYHLRQALTQSARADSLNVLQTCLPTGVDVGEIAADGVNNTTEPVSISCSFSSSDKMQGVSYFNPVLIPLIAKNPFSADNRVLPLQMPYCTQNVYILNMEVPEGYKVEELPKSVRIKLDGENSMFEYIAVVNGSHIQLRCTLVVKKAVFEPGEYKPLRDFFASVLKKQSEQFVFKKI